MEEGKSGFKVDFIVSGGQTGADRGGLEAAVDKGVPIKGWIPNGRRAEDGIVPRKYATLKETRSSDYRVRTNLNTEISDATLIFTYGKLYGGSKLTADFCRDHGKPWLHVDLIGKADAKTVADWVEGNNARTLNIAGQRESKAHGLQKSVREFVGKVLDELASR